MEYHTGIRAKFGSDLRYVQSESEYLEKQVVEPKSS